MQTSINRPEHAQIADRAPTGAQRLRTVTGNRFPRKCACGCNQPIPRDPGVRYVVDFGAQRPYPAYLREHSPHFGSYHGRPRAADGAAKLPGFVTAAELPVRPREVADEPSNGPAGD